MKKLGLVFLLFLHFEGKAQVFADPATGQMDVTNLLGTSLNANFIAKDSVAILNIPLYNLSQLVGLPSGSCRFIINLGSNIILDPAFNLSTAAWSNYLTWTSAVTNGELKITGNLIAGIPGDFNGIATFRIKGKTFGTSIIQTAFLVTNHNTPVLLFDEDPQNNLATLTYTVTLQPLPVTFTKMAVTKSGCAVQVNFSAEEEVNVDHYEIEISKDGSAYQNAKELAANKLIDYRYDFSLSGYIGVRQLFVRIKSVDKDGKFQYSETRTVAGTCDETAGKIFLFPNPTPRENSRVFIQSERKVFNGVYSVTLVDMSGKVVNNKTINLANAARFGYETGPLSPGQYLIRIVHLKDGDLTVLNWQKR